MLKTAVIKVDVTPEVKLLSNIYGVDSRISLMTAVFI